MDFTCNNCQTRYPEQYAYCPQCSQKTNLHRLDLHDIVHEAIHYFTHADKGVFQLIRDLLVKRGIVAREYVNGRRKKYFPPLSFFMLIATIFVFMATLGEPKETVNSLKTHPELSSITDPVKKQLAIEKFDRGEKVRHFTTKYSNLMAMCSLPLTALVFWLFYRKGKYNYIEHLVAGMYMLGICILIYALLILPLSYLFKFSSNYAVLLFFVVQLLYFSSFYYGFLEKTTKLHFAKAFGVSIVSLIVWVLFSGSLIRFYITSGFGGLVH